MEHSVGSCSPCVGMCDSSELREVSSCLDDVLTAVKSSLAQYHTSAGTSISICTPEVLFYEYDKVTKERKVAEETADTWDGPRSTELHCETCGESHADIIKRGPSGAGWRLDSLSVYIPDISGEQVISGRRPKECYAIVMCESCIQGKEHPDEVNEGFAERCSACGISNLLCCDEDVVEDYFHYNTYGLYGLCGFCPSCSEHLSEQEKAEKLYDRRDSLSIPHGQDYEARLHAQTEQVGDRGNVGQTEGLYGSDDDLDLSDSEDDLLGGTLDWEEAYEGEYENEELPENNTEKVQKVKDAVRSAGEKVFEIKDTLKEGDYLELMDLLQNITNSANTL